MQITKNVPKNAPPGLPGECKLNNYTLKGVANNGVITLYSDLLRFRVGLIIYPNGDNDMARVVRIEDGMIVMEENAPGWSIEDFYNYLNKVNKLLNNI